ncbi:serum deprivation-response protein-like [Sinocyclocheilus rhinocerous]|uniref:Serum deprivation-response protein-like n=1 Tax=Sinocyclocheilus rhinocerous TaxID=307959 RepID=A0A673LZB8_9TELE|nr:PREDICTED: serum deprivation-response protein-like [Sinocyclocheilus rhinocerous]
MGEDSSHAERSTATLPREESTPTPPVPDAQDAQDLLIPSFSPGSVPSSPIHTLSRLGSKSPTIPTAPAGQVSAITVVALLDKLMVMIETVQENQQRMEKKQAELEGAVRMVQGDVTRLTKNHMSTANSVAKLLERSRKTGLNVKEVRERLDRQSSQVKHLEANHAHLLKRNHFKVLIFQEDNEIPSTLLTKDGLASTSQDEIAPSAPTPLTDLNRSQDEGLQTISLSSDEDEEKGATSLLAEGGDDSLDLHEESFPGLGSERLERSRADKFKRSSLKKVDSLKKAFSRSSIEKKINKIVPPEQREKIKKSFIPNHPKSSSSKSSSFRVSPMTFNVKKVRDGDADSSQQPGSSPRNLSLVEVPNIGGPDGELPLAEKANGNDHHNPSTPGSGDGEVFVSDEGGDLENGPSATLAEEEMDKEDDDTDDHDENGKEEEEEEKDARPAEEASVSPPSAAATVELTS